MAGEPFERLTTRIHYNQLATALRELFEIGRRYGMVFDRVGANHDRHISIFDLIERRCHRCRSNIFHQCSHGRGMAQTGAVIHVVMAKTLTDDFLKKIGFFIGTFRTAKPGNRPPPIFRLERIQTICCGVKRLVPAGFAKKLRPVGRIHVQTFRGRISAPDQWLC